MFPSWSSNCRVASLQAWRLTASTECRGTWRWFRNFASWWITVSTSSAWRFRPWRERQRSMFSTECGRRRDLTPFSSHYDLFHARTRVRKCPLTPPVVWPPECKLLLPTERAVTTDGRYMFPVDLVQGSSKAASKDDSFLPARIAATVEKRATF